jgi:hypothetical protein
LHPEKFLDANLIASRNFEHYSFDFERDEINDVQVMFALAMTELLAMRYLVDDSASANALFFKKLSQALKWHPSHKMIKEKIALILSARSLKTLPAMSWNKIFNLLHDFIRHTYLNEIRNQADSISSLLYPPHYFRPIRSIPEEVEHILVLAGVEGLENELRIDRAVMIRLIGQLAELLDTWTEPKNYIEQLIDLQCLSLERDVYTWSEK